MKNCIILDGGRNETSLVAGSLSNCGYFMGDEVNAINKEMIATITPAWPKDWLEFFFRHRPGTYQLWLPRINLGVNFTHSRTLIDRIKKQGSCELYTPDFLTHFSFGGRIWQILCTYVSPGKLTEPFKVSEPNSAEILISLT